MRTVLLISSLLSIMGGVAVQTMEASNGPEKQPAERYEPQEVSFNLSPQPENPKRYILSISDDSEHSISGSFSTDQLQILRAIMVEAEKFAMTGEAVGVKEPITTRVMDKQESSFLVDVQKDSNQSLLFLTLNTEIGRMTWGAGRIIRSTRREEGFFFALLTRLESILPKVPIKPAQVKPSTSKPGFVLMEPPDPRPTVQLAERRGTKKRYGYCCTRGVFGFTPPAFPAITLF